MTGGVAFDSEGNAIVWVSNSTSFDSTVDASSVNSWVNKAGNAVSTTLSSVAAQTATTSSKKNTGISYQPSFITNLIMTFFAIWVV